MTPPPHSCLLACPHRSKHQSIPLDKIVMNLHIKGEVTFAHKISTKGLDSWVGTISHEVRQLAWADL